MLRGFALAILLLNLALLLWGGSRSGPDIAQVSEQDRGSAAALPTLVLLNAADLEAAESTPAVGPCLRLGPLSADDADTLLESFAAFELVWLRSDRTDGTVLNVVPGSSAVWPESEIRTLARVLAAAISPCRAADPIAPEPSRP